MLVALDYRIDFAMPTQIRDRNASSWRTTRVPPIEVSTERTRASRATRRPRAAPGTPAPVQRVGHEVDGAALVRPPRERSGESRVGKECGRQWGSRWGLNH